MIAYHNESLDQGGEIMKKIIRGFKHIHSYFHRCPYCGYSGNFPDSGSGECPSCGEVS